MIKYHILSLLALALAAFSGIEAAAQFYETTLKGANWYSNPKGWLMCLVTILAVFLYFRARTFRKRAVHNPPADKKID